MLDPEAAGNVMRWCNHDCNPSLLPVAVAWPGCDGPALFYIAARDLHLSRREELTINYGRENGMNSLGGAANECPCTTCKANRTTTTRQTARRG